MLARFSQLLLLASCGEQAPVPRNQYRHFMLIMGHRNPHGGHCATSEHDRHFPSRMVRHIRGTMTIEGTEWQYFVAINKQFAFI